MQKSSNLGFRGTFISSKDNQIVRLEFIFKPYKAKIKMSSLQWYVLLEDYDILLLKIEGSRFVASHETHPL
jgi:hypothetical protein